MAEKKALVIYYSHSGNTKFIAEKIAKEVGADLQRLQPKNDIETQSFLKFFLAGFKMISSEKPELKEFDYNPDDYEVIYIGSPIWMGKYTPALSSFLEKYNLKSKKIATFFCCGAEPGSAPAAIKNNLRGGALVSEMNFTEPIKGEKDKAAQAREWAQKVMDLSF